MTVQVQHRRSSTADKRPTAANLLEGEIALNFNNGTSGIFFEDSNGAVRKVGPAEVGSAAPNASPAAGGSTGNSTGEFWYDTANDLLKTYNGSSFVVAGGTTIGTTSIDLGATSTTLAGLTDVSTAKITFPGSTSGNVALQAAAASDSTTYTWPAADGTANFVLSTNGSGVLSWAEARTNDISDGDTSVSVNGTADTITLETGGTDQWVINADGDLVAQNANQDLASSSTPVDNAYVNTLTLTNDLGTSHGGTGLDGSSAANGTLLIGNGSGYTLTTLTAGEGLDVTNASGSITLSAEDAENGAGSANKGIASFESSDFAVTSGHVTLASTIAQSVSTDSGAATPANSTLTFSGGTGISTSGSGSTVTATLDNTAVSAAAYGAADTAATFTVDAQGRLTAAADVTISILHTQVSDFDAGVQTNRLDQMAAPTASVDFNAQRLTGLADPVNDQDAATKKYVDSTAQGLDTKASVVAASIANFASAYDNGTSGVGATLTASANGALSLDGDSPSAGDRVLIKDQTAALQNGIYTVTTVGDAGTAAVLTRATDFDAGAEIPSGYAFVEGGNTQAGNGYVCVSEAPVTVGTTAITFEQFSGAGQIEAGTGMTKSGNTLNVNGTADRITANADTIDIASTYVGQDSITTLGTITTGTWNATLVGTQYGGTGADGSNVTASYALLAPNGSAGGVTYREIQTTDIAPTSGGSFDGGSY